MLYEFNKSDDNYTMPLVNSIKLIILVYYVFFGYKSIKTN